MHCTVPLLKLIGNDYFKAYQIFTPDYWRSLENIICSIGTLKFRNIRFYCVCYHNSLDKVFLVIRSIEAYFLRNILKWLFNELDITVFLVFENNQECNISCVDTESKNETSRWDLRRLTISIRILRHLIRRPKE